MAAPLLTLLGTAAESLGMDRLLKVNTVKRWFEALMKRFAQILDEQVVFRDVLGVI